jgi:anti-sigma B factor antagonist
MRLAPRVSIMCLEPLASARGASVTSELGAEVPPAGSARDEPRYSLSGRETKGTMPASGCVIVRYETERAMRAAANLSAAPVAGVPAALRELTVCETGCTLRVLRPSSPCAAFTAERERGHVLSGEFIRPSAAAEFAAEQLAVEARTHRRTALVALRGELDLVTVPKVAEVIHGLEPRADGVRHIVLDLRGLTFMDLDGLRELIKQNDYAHTNRHNLAVVRGTTAVNRLLKLTEVEELLVLVDDPDDLVPPPLAH